MYGGGVGFGRGRVASRASRLARPPRGAVGGAPCREKGVRRRPVGLRGGERAACAWCGERMRYVGRDGSPVETALGRVEASMARHACAACGTTVRPRERALDIEGSMTPTAPRGCGGCSASGSRHAGDHRLQRRRRRRPCGGVPVGGGRLRRRAPRPHALRRVSRAGKPIGWGRVEAACKTVVGRRLKSPACAGPWPAPTRAVATLRAPERLVRRLLGRTTSKGRVIVSASSPRICRAPRPTGRRTNGPANS